MVKTYIIAKQSLHIKEFVMHFGEAQEISVTDIIQFYQGLEKDIKRSTVDWRIYELKNEGILHRVSRGVYSLHEVRHYIPEITRSNKLLYTSFKNQFPFVEGCLWHTMWINEFMLHQVGRFYTILEVEKDFMEAVFYGLKELGKEIYLNPSEEVLDKYVSSKKAPLIIISLVSEAPIQKVNGINTVTLEKMLVDLVCNETLFAAQQGVELKRIFRSAHEKYAISETKLLRYASRRNKKEEVETLYRDVQRNGNKL
ncbi:DUF6577 family protein [Lewinella sp. LCG006]|uniref:DUF6577 family protein n=1 Tax=Lewinella sp. LCG006 TaxID=3231911 RepID=UPI00345FF06F